MALPEDLKSRIARLESRLEALTGGSLEEDDDNEDSRENDLLNVLRDTCTLVREETRETSSYLAEMVEAAQKIMEKGVGYAYGDADLFDFMPSWAHNDDTGQPLIKESRGLRISLPAGAAREMARIMKIPKDSDDMSKH
ncbi:WD40 domain protein [Ceratobasidium sp. AG-Ba]|nr:WD40 domain protein [Ceratobasidium sp. AG-Ba]